MSVPGSEPVKVPEPVKGPEPVKVPEPRRVFDVHTHFNREGAPEVLAWMAANGVERVVNLSGGHWRKGLRRSLLTASESRGRIVPFYNVDWSMLQDDPATFGARIASDLGRAVVAGVGGLKISKGLGLGITLPNGNLLAVDDPLLDPIWRAAGAWQIPVSIHTADPVAFFLPITPQNERYEELASHPDWSFADPTLYPRHAELLAQLERVVARHPQTTFIGVHFGNNPEDPAWVERMLNTYPNFMVDIAARLGEFGRHPPKTIRALFLKHKDRILFGTDFIFNRAGADAMLILGSGDDDGAAFTEIHPFFEAHWRFLESEDASMPNPVPIQGRWDIFPLHLPADVLEAVYTGNAQRLVFGPHDRRRAAMAGLRAWWPWLP